MATSWTRKKGTRRVTNGCTCSTSYLCRDRAWRRGGVAEHATCVASGTWTTTKKAFVPRNVCLDALKVSFQGVPGAYSEQAAKKCYPDAEVVPCPDFETTHKQVADSSVDRAVIPVENSLGGSIHVNYDLLMKYRLHITGEVYHKVRHCLLANPGVAKEDIRRVQSHPQALAQCDGYLDSLNDGVIKEAVDDTAGAAQGISLDKDCRDTAALASSLAGELYGLDLLDQDCQDNDQNLTRFIILSRDPLAISEDKEYKTSIVFTAGDEPGDLFKALSVFALRDIYLTKIENRPIPQFIVESMDNEDLFQNLFYVDFKGSLSDESCQNALRHLSEVSAFMRILGSYPADA
ncbi:prephenate dehydratase [Chloropicon primus]|nr:prephenate dehydratase [Chloropicon primus]